MTDINLNDVPPVNAAGPYLLNGGAVSSSHYLATEAGAAVLREGGNAIDAAAAVHCTLNAVEPLASGLGGGAFWLIYLAATGRVYALDAREVAPAAVTADIFLDDAGMPTDENERAMGGLAVGVPGALAGLDEVLRRLGTITLARALEPAIEAAEDGVPVSAFMAGRIGLGSANNRARLAQSAPAAAMFLPGGKPLEEGALLLQSELGRTLRQIANGGPEMMYRGPLGRAIVEETRIRGGRLTLDDLTGYKPVWREPIVRPHRDQTVVTFGAPGSGASLLQMLVMLDSLQHHSTADEVMAAHLLVEVMRCGFADRQTSLGDPDHVVIPTRGLLHATFLGQRCELIDAETVRDHWDAGDPWPFEPDTTRPGTHSLIPDHYTGQGQTTHFTTADRWGNVVAVTATIESLFGSGIMVPETGLLLNNQMSDFSARPGGPNQIRPGARPASSMCPAMVLRDGRPVLTLGSPGGPTIAPTVLQVLLGVMDQQLPLQEAIDRPRLYAGPGRRITWEAGIPASLREALKERGHEVSPDARSIGNVQALAIDWDSGDVEAAADPRRQGAAIVVDGASHHAP